MQLQQKRDRLLAEVESLAATSDGHTQKMQDVHFQKLKAPEAQQVDEFVSKGHLCQRGILLEGMRVLECRPPFRQMQKMARIASRENMLSISSNPLVAMASQLSEAKKRERAFTGRGRCNKLRTMVDAKNLLQCIFSAAADARTVSYNNGTMTTKNVNICAVMGATWLEWEFQKRIWLSISFSRLKTMCIDEFKNDGATEVERST
ncbi:hypothetical protein AQUCO_03300062v1 [Aquilegia coerulea]|uniref:Kinesin motor domain-containing protein n=1 Tax=Aquilegia coerulea TaxID=218851 RepID=A0A2G5CZA8_AQUCA|nr:hypothetical protein AQUCO_03300062v1 [Aquilegia coerulea]